MENPIELITEIDAVGRISKNRKCYLTQVFVLSFDPSIKFFDAESIQFRLKQITTLYIKISCYLSVTPEVTEQKGCVGT